jgi:hypothetical protein
MKPAHLPKVMIAGNFKKFFQRIKSAHTYLQKNLLPMIKYVRLRVTRLEEFAYWVELYFG